MRPRPIIIATLLREWGTTGVQTHFNTFRDWLQLHGEQALVATPFQFDRGFAFPLYALRYLIDRMNGSASVWWYRYWHYFFLKRALSRELKSNSASVVYAQCPVSARAALAVNSPKRHRVVMMMHFNISQADEWSDKGRIQPHGIMFRKIQKLEEEVLPQLDGIVYVSRFMKDKLESRIEKMRNVENCIIPNFCVRPPENSPKGVRGDLINIGTLEPRKNQQFLLKVLAKAKLRGFRYRLSLVGDGPDRKMLERLSRELKIEKEVSFLGYRPDAAALISEHRAYVHSAEMESFGIVLIEAMAAGRPLLAAPVGGVPEVFNDGVEGFFWSLNDPDGGVSQLIALLENAELYQRMSRAALERYRSAFTTDLVAKQLRKFLLNQNR